MVGDREVNVMRRFLMLILALVVLVSVDACGSGVGVVQGHVLDFPAKLNSPKAGFIARFATTVEAKSPGQTEARQLVTPGHQFDFTLPSGTYTLDVVGSRICQASLTIRAGHTTHVDVRCIEP
jgi:hypothetical protein